MAKVQNKRQVCRALSKIYIDKTTEFIDLDFYEKNLPLDEEDKKEIREIRDIIGQQALRVKGILDKYNCKLRKMRR